MDKEYTLVFVASDIIDAVDDVELSSEDVDEIADEIASYFELNFWAIVNSVREY